MCSAADRKKRGQLNSHVLPVLVWLACVGCLVVLFRHRTEQFEVIGIAQGQVHTLAATCAGRLESLPVELFHPVSRGETLAVIHTVLDNENTEAELAVIAAEIDHLRADLIATRDLLEAEAADRRTDAIDVTRRFETDVEDARIQILQLKAEQETDRIAVEALALEVAVAGELLQREAVAPYELQKAENQYQGLARRIEETERLIAQAEQDLAQAQTRRDEYTRLKPLHPSTDNALAVIRKAIAVQEQQMAQINARHRRLVLTAPFDGVVSLIQKGPGETVLPGEVILTVTEQQPSRIVAYVDEYRVGRIQERMEVRLMTTDQPGQLAQSQVVSLGGTVEVLPQRLWRNPAAEQWGRPVLIQIPPGLELLPNQTVGIRGL